MPSAMDLGGIGAVAVAVLLALLAMSVASVAIAIDRAWSFRRAIADSRRCAVEVHPSIATSVIENAFRLVLVNAARLLSGCRRASRMSWAITTA